MTQIDPSALAAIAAALVLGGLVKGAIGAGAPVIAVPVITAFADVRVAVIVMLVPNLVANAWQLWQYRRHLPQGALALRYSLGGALGALLGTMLLVGLPVRALSLLVALAVTVYVGLRLARPDLRLSAPTALRWSGPAGTVGGILQGAAGISAPVSISYLSAMRLERPVFIATISCFFLSMAVVQLVALPFSGLLTWPLLALSLLACLPQMAAMPLGAFIARRVSAKAFEALVLGLLVILAVRLVWSALTG